MSASQLITAQGCKSCGHSTTQQGQLLCAFNPPTAAPVFQVGQDGAMKPIGWTASFPPVAPDLKCGQWKVRIVTATTLEKARI